MPPYAAPAGGGLVALEWPVAQGPDDTLDLAAEVANDPRYFAAMVTGARQKAELLGLRVGAGTPSVMDIPAGLHGHARRTVRFVWARAEPELAAAVAELLPLAKPSVVDRARRKLERRESETDFQAAVVKVMESLGWQWMHIRPARTRKGWRTAIEGPLGPGWLDLFAIHVERRRMLFAELKAERHEPSNDQVRVMAALQRFAGDHTWVHGGIQVDVYLWRPSDLRQPVETSTIYQELAR